MKTLGVLSGIGAAAGVHMAQRLVEVSQENGAKGDADFPDFLLYNMPTDATDEKGIKDPRKLLSEIGSALRKFNVWGCDYLLIACNTVHHYLPEIKDRFGGAIINMVELACKATFSAKHVAVLCSASSRESGLYRRCLQKFNPEVEVLYPNEGEQLFINGAIEAAIKGDRPDKYWKSFHALTRTLKQRGAQYIILGCTELPLCLKGHQLHDHVIDAGDVAVREAHRLLTTGAPSN